MMINPLHICLHFKHAESYCINLINLLKKMLPEYEIHHGHSKNENGELIEGHSIWLDAKKQS